VENHRHDKNGERENGYKEKTDLKSEAGIMFFKRVIGDESGQKNKEERPRHVKRGAPEIKDDKSAQKSAEEKLQYVDIPKMFFGRVFFVHCLIFLEVDQDNKDRDKDEVRGDPKIFPKQIHALESKRIKNKTAH